MSKLLTPEEKAKKGWKVKRLRVKSSPILPPSPEDYIPKPLGLPKDWTGRILK